MQYLFLLYGDEDGEAALGPEGRREIVDAHMKLSAELAERGVLVGGAPVGPSSRARRVEQGLVVDGPFAETKEQLGGYYVIECADLDEALGLARRIPQSPGLVVEVREIPAG